MNKVTTVNLNGVAFQVEEDGYEALRAYLDSASRRLEGNPDRSEIIADIEQAIGEKCRVVLGSYKTVVTTPEIRAIIAEMGPVEDTSAPGGFETAGGSPPPPAPAGGEREGPRRLFRIREGRMLGGVCNGIAAYIGLDVTLIRLVFVVLGLITFGAAALAYLVLLIVVPPAQTPAEKLAASGDPLTAQEFIRRAKAGYYEGMRTFADKRAHREWRRRFRDEMRGWRREFRREMRENRWHWRGHWHHEGWGPRGGAHAFWLALPLVSLLRGACLCLFLCALVSLLATGAVFGIAPPAGIPVWLAIVILFLLYKAFTWPLRLAFRASLWGGGAFCTPLAGFSEALVGWLVVVVLLWLGWHHAGQVRDAVAAVPSEVHRAAAAISRWWHSYMSVR